MLRVNSISLELSSILIAAMSLAGCAAMKGDTTAMKVPPRPTPAPVVYSLPRTTLIVALQVERSKESPGTYCDFLDLFFPEMDAVAICQIPNKSNPGDDLADGRMKTSITGFSVNLKGTPDPNRTHEVNFDASWHVERTDSIAFTEGGTLTGADMQRTDRTAEIIMSVLSNGAKIAGRFVFGAGSNITVKATSDKPWERLPGVKENFGILSAARQKIYEDLWDKPEQKARLTLAARSYEDIKNSYAKLDTVLSGAGAQGAATLVPELEKRIADRLASDFLGFKTKDTWNPVYELTPEDPTAGHAGATTAGFALFSFAGCGVTKESTKPVQNTLNGLRCPIQSAVTPNDLRFAVKTSSGQPAKRLSTPDVADSAKVSLYHIRPEAVTLNLTGTCSASLTLKRGDDPEKPTVLKPTQVDCGFADQSSLLAQWGVQATLPNAGQNYAYTVSLYQATGALQSVKLTSKAALSKDTVDSAFGIVNTLLDAKDTADAAAKKKADDAAAKADELNVLTRQRQILEEKAKIKQLCDQLGLSNCGN